MMTAAAPSQASRAEDETVIFFLSVGSASSASASGEGKGGGSSRERTGGDVGALALGEVRPNLALLDLGVVDRDVGVLGEEVVDEVDRGRLAGVASVLLEGEPAVMGDRPSAERSMRKRRTGQQGRATNRTASFLLVTVEKSVLTMLFEKRFWEAAEQNESVWSRTPDESREDSISPSGARSCRRQPSSRRQPRAGGDSRSGRRG